MDLKFLMKLLIVLTVFVGQPIITSQLEVASSVAGYGMLGAGLLVTTALSSYWLLRYYDKATSLPEQLTIQIRAELDNRELCEVSPMLQGFCQLMRRLEPEKYALRSAQGASQAVRLRYWFELKGKKFTSDLLYPDTFECDYVNCYVREPSNVPLCNGMQVTFKLSKQTPLLDRLLMDLEKISQKINAQWRGT